MQTFATLRFRAVRNMKTKGISPLAVLVCLLISSTPLLAHHGYAAYDMTQKKTLKGTITNYEMANPHSRISFDVKDDKGNVQSWVVECAPPIRVFKAQGFDYDTLKPGDVVTITFNPGKDGANVGVLIHVQFPDGHVLPRPNSPNPNPEDSPKN